MKNSSDDDIRKKIIGLGDSSIKKSYYSQLQEKVRDLEDKQKLLMATVRTLEERENELENLLNEKNGLIHELNHRVKNNLQLITSLLSLGSLHANDIELSHFNKSLRRVETVSMVYQDSIFSENYTDVTMLAMIRNLAIELRAYAGKPNVRLRFDFPDEEIILLLDNGIAFALIINEVVLNSFKHAFPDDKGELVIKVERASGSLKSIKVSISDEGSGLFENSDKENSETFGMSIIEALSTQINADYSYTDYNSGTLFTLEFELDDL